MAEDQPRREPALQVAATASNAAEADLMCQRLAQAGIQAISQRSIGGPEWGVSGAQYVYVEPGQLDRARQILSEPAGISEDELARLSDEPESEDLPRRRAGPLPGADESEDR
jgi:hypothetical protein